MSDPAHTPVDSSGSEGDFDSSLLEEISLITLGRLRERVLGASCTTFAIGGPLRAVITVESEHELSRVLELLKRNQQRYRTIGFGSNVLISDSGVPEWIIRLGASFRQVSSLGGNRFEVGASASFMALARKVSQDGLSGLEFAAGIPASVGGAAYMNAGAHGGEIAERIASIHGVGEDGEPIVWQGRDLPWRYRSSGIPSEVVITRVILELVPGDPLSIRDACAHNLRERRARQPLSMPSAGSVFRNPSAERSAGQILEQVGMKGVTVGGAMVSELHANWIVNPDRRASATDVLALMRECIDRAGALGVSLEPEVKRWGDGLAL